MSFLFVALVVRSHVARADLSKAQKNKNDEFYTQLVDIENELKHYKDFFKDKVVFCNCDDPFESNFFKYFAMNFNHLGLKKIVCTCYAGSPISHTELNDLPLFNDRKTEKLPYMIEIAEVKDFNGDGAEDLADIEILIKNDKNTLTLLDGDGDFRSEESIEILKEADVVVTNPPFSLFREYIAQLIQYNKKFIILSNMNAITYKEIFPLIKNNKMWIGYGFNMSMVYKTPYPNLLEANRQFVKQKGYNPDDGYVKVPAIAWFTNIDIEKRHEKMILYKQYNPVDYPKYDNYDAINVDKVSEIPMDYSGTMGVPITFLNNHNPNQFEIIALGNSRENFSPTKTYINPIKHLNNGDSINGNAINCVLAIKVEEKPIGQIYYSSDNVDYIVAPYARILIKRKDN